MWDCHTNGDSPSAGNETAAGLQELQRILRAAGSKMRAAVLEENGDAHNMMRMLGHVTQNHTLSRLELRIRPNSESGRTPNPNPAELRNLVEDLRIARIDPSRGGGIKETRVDLF